MATWLMPYPRYLLNCSPLFSLPQLLPPPHCLQVVYFSCKLLAPMLQSPWNSAQKWSRSHVTLKERQSPSAARERSLTAERHAKTPKLTGKLMPGLTEGEHRGKWESAEVTGKHRKGYFSYLNQWGEWPWLWVATAPRGCSQRFPSPHSLASLYMCSKRTTNK